MTSRAEEWALELSELAADHHGQPHPTASDAIVVLTPDERRAGLRATRDVFEGRVLAEAIRSAALRRRIRESIARFEAIRERIEWATGHLEHLHYSMQVDPMRNPGR